jgi:D-lactate dehydrogenase (cytochrome)
LRKISGRGLVEEQAGDLLGDESNLAGSWCEEAAWPSSEAEAAAYVQSCAGRGMGLTISGGLTGVTGGALPDGGAVLSTRLLQGIGEIEGGVIEVAAGTALEDLRKSLDDSREGLFFPPDPTEWSATLGGMAATDASGSDSLMHGSARRWIDALHCVFSTGEAAWLRRGDYTFGADGLCSHPSFGTLALPPGPAALPDKDTAGYRMRPGMDLVDLLLGSEGTLCLITALELKLERVPAHTAEVVMFPGSTSLLWPALGRLYGSGLRLRALEMMDDRCLDLMRSDPLPDGIQPPRDACCAVMARIDADSDAGLGSVLEVLDSVSSGLGLPERLVWAGLDETGDTRIRRFRHQLPEIVNREIARRAGPVPGIHKLGSDSAVGFDRAAAYHETVRAMIDSGGFEGIVFGHAGQGHLHANILPRTREEMERARTVMLEIARAAVRVGGTVSAEHGLGRIKAHLLREMHPPEVISAMTAIRRAIDPAGLFNPAIRWA